MHKILVIKKKKKEERELEYFLRRSGYRCEFAYDGASGIQLALTFKPDLIISELNLSALSGIDVFNLIKKIDFLQLVPFILLSSKNRSEEILEGIQLGMDGFIEKPINYATLELLLRNRIERVIPIRECYKRKCCFFHDNPFLGTFLFKNYHFTEVNKRFEDILGYNKNDLLGKTIFDVTLDNDIIKIIQGVNNCVKQLNQRINAEIRFHTKEKNTIHAHFHATIKNENHGNFLLLGYILPVHNCKIMDSNSKTNDIQLSKREIEILDLICKGYTNQEIGELLFLSERTIEGHRARIMNKTNSKNTVQLVIYAIKHQYVCIT